MSRCRCLGQLPGVRCTPWTTFKPVIPPKPRPSTPIHCELRYCLDDTQPNRPPVVKGEVCANMAGKARAKLWRHTNQVGEWGAVSVAEAKKFIDREIQRLY